VRTGSPGGIERALHAFHSPDQAGDPALDNGLQNLRLGGSQLSAIHSGRPQVQMPKRSHISES